MKLPIGKRLQSVASARDQPGIYLVHFLVDGSASVLRAGESLEECGSFGSVIASSHMQRLGLRNSACAERCGASATFMLRMLA